MSLTVHNHNIDRITYGDDEISEVFHGSDLVWQKRKKIQLVSQANGANLKLTVKSDQYYSDDGLKSAILVSQQVHVRKICYGSINGKGIFVKIFDNQSSTKTAPQFSYNGLDWIGCKWVDENGKTLPMTTSDVRFYDGRFYIITQNCLMCSDDGMTFRQIWTPKDSNMLTQLVCGNGQCVILYRYVNSTTSEIQWGSAIYYSNDFVKFQRVTVPTRSHWCQFVQGYFVFLNPNESKLTSMAGFYMWKTKTPQDSSSWIKFDSLIEFKRSEPYSYGYPYNPQYGIYDGKITYIKKLSSVGKNPQIDHQQILQYDMDEETLSVIGDISTIYTTTSDNYAIVKNYEDKRMYINNAHMIYSSDDLHNWDYAELSNGYIWDICVGYANNKFGHTIRFSNIGINEDGGIVDSQLLNSEKQVLSGFAYGYLPTPESSTSYSFDHWYNSDGVKITQETIVSSDNTETLSSYWVNHSSKTYEWSLYLSTGNANLYMTTVAALKAKGYTQSSTPSYHTFKDQYDTVSNIWKIWISKEKE